MIAKNPDVVVKLCGSSTALDEATYDAYIAELAGVAAVDEGKVILLNNECGTTAIGAVIGRPPPKKTESYYLSCHNQ